MEIYRLSEKYLKAAHLKGKFLERAKKKRFRIISGEDKYGGLRVFELHSGYRHTYHKSFLAVDKAAWQKLRANITGELNADFEVDLTQKDGFTQARKLCVDKIMDYINAYLDSCLELKYRETRNLI